MANERILVVDDERGVRALCCDLLKRAGYQAEAVDSGPAALGRAAEHEFDVVLADVNMPRMDGIELCRRLRHERPDQIVVLITGYPSIENAVRGMKEGARDYVTKPFTPDELRLVVARALEERTLREENERMRRDLRFQHGLDSIVGVSPSMQQLFETARKVAVSDTTALIEGESGTGKELFARAIHVHSPRATRPFVPVNCGSIVGTLLESEMFGHTKGAFTGAHANKLGLFQVASGGTIFLDEIGELALELQPKLLRVLQEGEVKPVGAVETRKVDVRVVAATNRDLLADVRAGRFREDLYYRLNVICLKIPPLRERSEDVPHLVDRFITAYAQKARRHIEGITDGALRHLQAQPWPGNVRELQNAVERAIILSSGPVIDVADFTQGPSPSARPATPPRPAATPYPFHGMCLEEVERRHIEYVMQSCGGQRTRAAETLGINRTTLWKKLRQYEGSPADEPEPDAES
jgi:two-component system, NtrC family, response regulator AtoC